MASVFITTRHCKKDGTVRHLVWFHLGGAGARNRYLGSFKRRSEANERATWARHELAAMRIPDYKKLREAEAPRSSLREAAERWRTSRVDVAEDTLIFHRTALNRAVDVLGTREAASITTDDIVQLVTTLAASGKKRGTIAKTLQTLAMVLDDVGLNPNPARDRVKVRLPREDAREHEPPAADQIEAVYRLLPSWHRVPLLFLDWSGARVAAIDKTLVGDYDERNGRVRLSKAVTKQRRGVWVDLRFDLGDGVTASAIDAAIRASLPPRDDRDLGAKLFGEANSAALRRAIARSCKAAGVPLFSPHDFRHRRISLLHDVYGWSWPRVAEWVGQKDLAVTANTYSHVMVDPAELDYEALLPEAERLRQARPSVLGRY
jgi:integrase